MKKLLLLAILFAVSFSLFAGHKKNINLCKKIYPRKKIIKGIKIKECDKKYFTNQLTDLNHKPVNVNSIITKNKFTLIAFSSIYAIGCGSNIGVREALLKSLIKDYNGKIIEFIEYWDNDEMNRTVSEIQDKKIKYSYTFEIVKDLPIYLDRDGKNIMQIISETGAEFLHSGWAIVDSNHHIKYLFMEGSCEENRKMKKTERIIRKYLKQ